VPGRSFCGRVMETGWEVKRMKKGDMVFGLQSSRKCGALAEFMTIDQNLLAKAPENCLTTEEIAALPSVGVMAHQLMTNHCSQLKRGSRLLILNAHDGVGLLTMQESANLGLIIVAHCPDSISDGVALCEANGAHEVVIGDALWAINSLHEGSFDLILDTVGGRKIYDASRRILAFEGQFCTCVGDVQTSANPNLRSHLRSLRRSFFKKDTKRIGYEWIGTDTGEDCREALEAVKLAAEKGQICPRLQSILSFGEAPRAFESTLRGGENEPGSIVVKIS
jgi:NADPH:quinone reductase-like Zn-dependent oxidoreductase